MLTCIIIDSGVSYDHPLVDRNSISGFSLSFSEDGEICYSENFDDQYGHGTAIYNILQDLKNDVNIINIRLSAIENELVDENALISTLEFIEREYSHVDVINLSLGMTICDRQKELYEICKRFDHNGTVILSAFDNEDAMSFPATFDCVIGVVSLNECVKKNEFVFIDDSYINIGAKGGIQRLAWKEPRMIFANGNSFACAHATKQTLQIMLSGVLGRQAVLQEFKTLAINSYKLSCVKPENKGNFPLKGRLAIFPFNKEMHSLLRFKQLLNFDIVNVYDIKKSIYLYINII